MGEKETFTKNHLKELVVKLQDSRVDVSVIKKYVDSSIVDEVFADLKKKEDALRKQKQSDDRLSFDLTEEHVKLMKRLNIKWIRDDSYLGHIEIDAKRPYGNSDIEDDIAKIIGLKLLTNQYDEVEMSKEQYVQVRKLHEEVKFALEILVVSGKAELGKYTRKDNYGDDWKKVV